MGVIDADMRGIVESAMLSFVATVSPDGAPNLSPKGSVRVYDDDHLAFMDIASPHTMANLRRDPRVEVNAVDVFKRRGYRFAGEAAIVAPGHPVYEWLHDWLLALNGPGYPANEAALITVRRAAPIRSPAYTWGGARESDLVASFGRRYVEAAGLGPLAADPTPDGADHRGSAPRTMRAAFIRHRGGVERIEVGQLPVPRPGGTEVLVRLTATAVNHVDLFVRSGAYRTPIPLPFVIGRDLVGTVVEAGAGVTEHRVGDRVWCNSLGYGGRQGTFSEYVSVQADRLYRLPDRVDPLAAAPVLHAGATAHLGLLRTARVQPGETVLVGHASGAVGSAAVQVAAAVGARVLATAAVGDAEWCRACGAETVIDQHTEGAVDRIRAAAPDGVDVWWDTSGEYDLGAWLPLLRHGGRIVVAAGLDAAPVLPVGPLYTADAAVCGFAISNASVDDLAAAARTVNGLLPGRLRGRVGATYRLEDAAAAHRALESGAARGRILVVP
ncbi:alcohol dehydrogenase catalytic domain-containing protein [Rhodococcus sp. NPDC058505]|uniref:alcohol dehydrogenase catalytic domain-containing protein n=1 Tax=unclassified Rhodococcus (in: high G+C Gram-positive bacteria) TaxID=192944 RepID=UPI0036488BB6